MADGGGLKEGRRRAFSGSPQAQRPGSQVVEGGPLSATKARSTGTLRNEHNHVSNLS